MHVVVGKNPRAFAIQIFGNHCLTSPLSQEREKSSLPVFTMCGEPCKLYIGMLYCGKRFWDPYMLIFLSKFWWQKSDILSQASYMYPILWETFFDPSDSYFLFADLVGFYTHLTYMHIFLSNCWWQESDIWSEASYRYPISW